MTSRESVAQLLSVLSQKNIDHLRAMARVYQMTPSEYLNSLVTADRRAFTPKRNNDLYGKEKG